MAAQAFDKINYRHHRFGYRNDTASSAQLYEGAKWNNQRQYIYGLQGDAQLQMSGFTRTRLSDIARFLYANDGMIEGVINELACLAGMELITSFVGHDEDWADAAGQFLALNDEMGILEPITMSELRQVLVISVLVDGDIGLLLTETENGFPAVQVIPSHRIGSRDDQREVIGGPFDGSVIIDGVVLNRYGAPIGYQVLGNSKLDDRIYGKRDFELVYMRKRPGQIRGISALASGVNSWQDIKLTKLYELAAQKLGAYQGIIETNEDGEPSIDAAKRLARGSEPTVASGSETSTPEVYNLNFKGDGGLIKWFKHGKGSLQAFRNDRPSQDSVSFWKQVMREALLALGVPYDWAVDPTNINGAPARMTLDRVNRVVRKLRKCCVIKSQRRIDTYRIAKAIKMGRLPFNPDWWKREYRGGADLTADAKNQADTDLLNVNAGFESPQNVIAARGGDWKRVVADTITFHKHVQEQAEAAGVDVEKVSTGNAKNPQKAGEGGATGSEQDAGRAEQSAEVQSIKERADAYGVAVRAGAVTPQRSDEEQFREALKLPGIGQEILSAWEKDGGTRRPITLVQNGAQQAPQQAQQSQEEDE